jgi:lipopolysaccharide transport system ATP-binding protein
MSQYVIEARSLSKRYRVGEQPARYSTIREALVRMARAPFGAVGRAGRGRTDTPNNEFWALSDVSFDVAPGEVVGVIGPNGAGKSTLLKILSRIAEPTLGEAMIEGRMGSLLEVGTGFHLELSGRENIFLNGAILGMRRAEIQRKFDEIVAFAEVDRFVDTPVKHYSSGMYLRLAFAVAAHLEPEILLVDEVLAVGDIAFQQKCLGKMNEVAAQGRTVLFVSHNLGAVRELCHSSLVLDRGRVVCRGSVVEGLATYSQCVRSEKPSEGGRNGWHDVAISSTAKGYAATIHPEEGFTVHAVLDLDEEVEAGRLFCLVEDGTGHTFVHQRIELEELRAAAADPYHLPVDVRVPALWLAPGVYSAYFKFIGRTGRGADVRRLSERAVLDVAGSVSSLGKALLAPRATWEIRAESPLRPPAAALTNV